jgi:thymidylate synthase (FAD)
VRSRASPGIRRGGACPSRDTASRGPHKCGPYEIHAIKTINAPVYNRCMAHTIVPEAEALLDQPLPVLDKGFVRLVDYMGSDARIVAAARVSYGAGTKTMREDRMLIQYLYRNAHTSPFEQVQLTFHCKLPLFVARQWIRHRTARVNELSGRYSMMRDEFYLPDAGRVQYQKTDNKQGSGASMPHAYSEAVVAELHSEQAALYQSYSSMLDTGVARELARINLPLSLYTEWYWQIDLHNLFHFLRLRLDVHAQYEIREYAKALAQCAKAVAPLAYEAFEQFGLNAASFSASELRLLRKALAAGGIGPESDLTAFGKLTAIKRAELVNKLWGADAAGQPEEIKPVER